MKMVTDQDTEEEEAVEEVEVVEEEEDLTEMEIEMVPDKEDLEVIEEEITVKAMEEEEAIILRYKSSKMRTKTDFITYFVIGLFLISAK